MPLFSKVFVASELRRQAVMAVLAILSGATSSHFTSPWRLAIDFSDPVRWLRVRHAIPSNAIPSNDLPADIFPPSALPSSTLPLDAIVQNALPSSAIPSNAIPSNAIPSNAIPSNAIPSNAIPSNAIPSNAIPSNAIPSNALPSSAVPVGVNAEAVTAVRALPSSVTNQGFLRQPAFSALISPAGHLPDFGEIVCGASGCGAGTLDQVYVEPGSELARVEPPHTGAELGGSAVTESPTFTPYVPQPVLVGTVTPTHTTTVTPTATVSPSVTPTHTETIPLLWVDAATHCRSGPGQAYAILAALQPGQTAVVLKRYPQTNYYVIATPGGVDQCWVWGQYAHTSGPVDQLPIASPPPPPTTISPPTPDRTPTVMPVTIYVHNNTGAPMCGLWLAPGGSDYGPNRLSSPLPHGSSIAVTLAQSGAYYLMAHTYCGEGYEELVLWASALSDGQTVTFTYP